MERSAPQKTLICAVRTRRHTGKTKIVGDSGSVLPPLLIGLAVFLVRRTRHFMEFTPDYMLRTHRQSVICGYIYRLCRQVAANSSGFSQVHSPVT